MKKHYLIFTILMLLGSLKSFGQQDSFHILIKDTLLKAGTKVTIHFAFKEKVNDIEGFQFCIGYDKVNLKLNTQIVRFYIPGMDENSVNTQIDGLLPVTFYNFSEPYQGYDIMDVEFEVLNDCRVKNVLSILPAFRYTSSGSFFYSEIYKGAGTFPIATSYIPFKNVANKKGIQYINASFSPNPLVATSQLQFEIPAATRADLDIYTVAGNKVKTIPVQLNAGSNTITIEKTKELLPGMYQYTMRMEGAMVTGKFQVR